MRQSFGCSVFVHLALGLWTRKKALFFFLNAVSLAGNLISLLPLLRWDALASVRILLCNTLPGLWRTRCILMQPPYLYILLNLILITVVMKSGILSPRREGSTPKGRLASKIHRIASWRSSLHDFDVEESVDSNYMMPAETNVWQKRPSLFTIEPFEIDQDVVFQPAAPRNLGEEDHSLFMSGTRDSILSTSVTQQHMNIYDQKPAPACNYAHMNDTCVKVDAQIVLIEESGPSEHPDQQLVQNDGVEDSDDEISTEELNSRAEAYIKKVRQNWWLQRQNSFNRLYGLISGDNRLR